MFLNNNDENNKIQIINKYIKYVNNNTLPIEYVDCIIYIYYIKLNNIYNITLKIDK